MGTNYYLKYPEHVVDECVHCGSKSVEQKTRHIGKSSAGWYFSLHVQPEDGLHNFEDWLDEISSVMHSGGAIEDEYGTFIELHEFINVAINRTTGAWKATYPNRFYDSEVDMLKHNNAERGINGLLKHIADGKHCVGHSDGPVSYIVGDFF